MDAETRQPTGALHLAGGRVTRLAQSGNDLPAVQPHACGGTLSATARLRRGPPRDTAATQPPSNESSLGGFLIAITDPTPGRRISSLRRSPRCTSGVWSAVASRCRMTPSWAAPDHMDAKGNETPGNPTITIGALRSLVEWVSRADYERRIDAHHDQPAVEINGECIQTWGQVYAEMPRSGSNARSRIQMEIKFLLWLWQCFMNDPTDKRHRL